MEAGLQGLDHQDKLVLWSKRISACRSSGMNVKAWCEENGVCLGTYYKWQRKLYQMAAAGTTTTEPQQFVEVSARPRSTPVAVLHIGNAAVELMSGIEESTLTALCRALNHAE